MIPKILHSIEFNIAENNKHPYFKRCNLSQKRFFASWEQKIWTEEDFLHIIQNDVWKLPHGHKLLELEAWAFMSDVIRMYALHTYGGVYADWDVEFVKNIPDYMWEQELVLGFEPYTISGVGTAQVGVQLCMSTRRHSVWPALYEVFRTFLWTEKFTILPELCTRILEEFYGLCTPRNKYQYYYLKEGIVIVPYDIFYPFMGTRIFSQNPLLTETQLYNKIQVHTVALHWEHSQMVRGTVDNNGDNKKKGWTMYLNKVQTPQVTR